MKCTMYVNAYKKVQLPFLLLLIVIFTSTDLFVDLSSDFHCMHLQLQLDKYISVNRMVILLGDCLPSSSNVNIGVQIQRFVSFSANKMCKERFASYISHNTMAI